MKRALIIEDDETLVSGYKLRLEIFGFECDVALLGAVALEKLRTSEYDVAIVDIRLPDISGLDILRTVPKEISRVSTEATAELAKWCVIAVRYRSDSP